MKRFRILRILLIFTTSVFGGIVGSEVDLTTISLEDLMNIEVTLATRTPDKLTSVPAAIYVITSEDIQQLGMQSIPFALRYAPGMQVASLNANVWAVGARGFNALLANKLQVMMDGRSVYTPLFMGVTWDAQELMLQDIDRIEVIRGSGAALWGSNAFNGIIHIVSKKTNFQPGGMLYLGSGTEEKFFSHYRYAGQLNDRTWYRVHLKYYSHEPGQFITGEKAKDDWHVWRGGFRIDHSHSATDEFTLHGGAYKGDLGETSTGAVMPEYSKENVHSRVKIDGAYILGKWTHIYNKQSDFAGQIYLDHTLRSDPILFDGYFTRFDIDIQHRFPLFGTHQWMWGAGAHFVHDKSRGTVLGTFDPASDDYRMISAFVQDEIEWIDEHLYLTLGSKFEYNNRTHFNSQPNIRVSWLPTSHTTVWGALSKALRIPSRGDEDIVYQYYHLNSATYFPQYPPRGFSFKLYGDNSLEPERLISRELGWRWNMSEKIYIDIAAFHNQYTNIITSIIPMENIALAIGQLISGDTTNLEAVGYRANELKMKSYGFEIVSKLLLSEKLDIKAMYSYLRMTDQGSDLDGSRLRVNAFADENPVHQISVLSSARAGSKVNLTLGIRYVDQLPGIDIDHYVGLDGQISVQCTNHVTIGISGQNLLDKNHFEFRDSTLPFVESSVVRNIRITSTVMF